MTEVRKPHKGDPSLPKIDVPKWDVTKYGSPLEGLLVGSSLPGFNSESFMSALRNGQMLSLDPLLPVYLREHPEGYEDLKRIRDNQKFLAKGDMIAVFADAAYDLGMEGVKTAILLGEPGQNEWRVEFYRGDEQQDVRGFTDRLAVDEVLADVMGLDLREDGLFLVYNPGKIQKSKQE